VVRVERELVHDGARSFWAICVVWLSTPKSAEREKGSKPRQRVDYRQVLSPDQFKVYVRLRELRKALAERDGVPPYAVFTNEQLAQMVQRPVRTLAEMEALPGAGPSRISKYGASALELLTSATELGAS
jgi:superfamily II DNA helicase RecQ